jgi:hypothetical protein
MKLEGQKTVPDARFVPFLQTTLLLADFLCVEHGEGETKVIQILPLGVAESTAAEGDELLGVEEEHYVLDFGAPSAAKSTTLFEFAVSCTGVEGMQFTWSPSTEERLKDRRVRLRGKRRIPKHQLQSFFTTMMSISDFSCATFGDGEIKVIRVQPYAESFANEPGEMPISTPSLKEPVVLTFGTRTIAESTSLMELAWTCQKTTGRVLTWNQATDALLSEQRMRIVGTRSMQGPGFLLLFESLLTASNYSWEEVTTDVGPRIKIEAR